MTRRKISFLFIALATCSTIYFPKFVENPSRSDDQSSVLIRQKDQPMNDKERIPLEARFLRRISAVNNIPMTALKIEDLDKEPNHLFVSFSAQKDGLQYKSTVGINKRDEINLVHGFRDSDLDYKLKLTNFNLQH